MQWYPLKLSIHVRAYAFGGQNIAAMLGKTGLPDGTVAETWEISDYRQTAGTVMNGALAGTGIHQLVTDYPDDLVGAGWRGPISPCSKSSLMRPTPCRFTCTPMMPPPALPTGSPTARPKRGIFCGLRRARRCWLGRRLD